VRGRSRSPTTASVSWIWNGGCDYAVCYKPWGLTGYGRRGTIIESDRDLNASRLWTGLWFAGLIAALSLFALMHVFGGGMHHH
jgi:hypothetical protein